MMVSMALAAALLAVYLVYVLFKPERF